MYCTTVNNISTTFCRLYFINFSRTTIATRLYNGPPHKAGNIYKKVAYSRITFYLRPSRPKQFRASCYSPVYSHLPRVLSIFIRFRIAEIYHILLHFRVAVCNIYILIDITISLFSHTDHARYFYFTRDSFHYHFDSCRAPIFPTCTGIRVVRHMILIFLDWNWLTDTHYTVIDIIQHCNNIIWYFH